MKILCVIAARGGSKGIPSKNIRMINGKPLISYAIESAVSSNCFDKIVVSTDDKKIATIAKTSGASVPFYRPSHLAQDDSAPDDAILHCLHELAHQNETFDIVVLRDCTVPFIDEIDIQNSLKLFSENSCDVVAFSIKAHPNPYFGMMEPDKDGCLIPSKNVSSDICRRQDSPIVYDVDGMFILDVKNFLKTKKIFSGKIIPFEISKEHGHMIDFEFDFKVAELLMKAKS